ncbi:MAG: DUF5715 family protein [bacterium]|nr:DUF5715 family protein [bacterium]
MKKILIVFAVVSVFGILCFSDNALAKMRRIKKLRPAVSLKASPESLALQNRVIDAYELPRISDRKELARHLPEHFFVRVSSSYLEMSDEVGGYATLPTRDFILKLGEDFFVIFKRKLKVTSLLRTVEDQQKIVDRGQSIADGFVPESQSSHLAGVAIDISKKPLSPRERRWLAGKLLAYKKAGKIEAIEEMWNNAFHIMVCPNWQAGRCF